MTSGTPTGRGLAAELELYLNTCVQNEGKPPSTVKGEGDTSSHPPHTSPATTSPWKRSSNSSKEPQCDARIRTDIPPPGGPPTSTHFCTEFILSVDLKGKDREGEGDDDSWAKTCSSIFSRAYRRVNFRESTTHSDLTDNAKDG